MKQKHIFGLLLMVGAAGTPGIATAADEAFTTDGELFAADGPAAGQGIESGTSSTLSAQDDTDGAGWPSSEAAQPALTGQAGPAETTGAGGSEALSSIPVAPIAPEAPKVASHTEERAAPYRLEEIVVTATKREQSAREIPVSITALSGEELEKTGARDIKDYLMKAPGITMDESEHGEAVGRRMTIRGIGPGQSGIGNQTVGQFIGDAPMGDPYTNYGVPDLDPFDLKTVEILRGPQGTTFGASALNGAVRYVPNEPVLNEWSGRAFVDHVMLDHTGSLDHDGGQGTSYGAAFNAPIGDEIAFRASGVFQKAPGVYDNLQREENNANSYDKWSGRGALRWEPTDRFSANLMYLKQLSHTHDVLSADNGEGNLENNNKPGPSTIDFGFSLANADLRYEFDDWGTVVYQFTHQTKISNGDIDSGVAATGSQGIESLRASFTTDVKGSTHELRLVSPNGGRWDWIVGLFSRDYEADVTVALDTTVIRNVTLVEILPLEAKESAVYGELTRRFGDHWEATVGARHYTTEMNGIFDAHALGLVPLYHIPIDQKEDGVNPKFSLAYKANDSLMAYVTFARGFQFGGVNTPVVVPLLSGIQNPVTGTPIPLTYDSSVLWNREIGLRTDWLDRTLRFDIAYFDIQWTDAQLSDNAGGALQTPFIDNIGEVSSRGVESSFTWLTPLDGLSVNVIASYIRAVTASEYDNGDSHVAKGAEMPASPKVQTSATLSYNTSFGQWLAGTSVTHNYWGPAYSDLQHSYDIYDFSTWSLSANVARPDLPLMPTLTVGVTNLTDERGVVGRNIPDTVAGDTYVYIRPRAISIRLTAEFY